MFYLTPSYKSIESIIKNTLAPEHKVLRKSVRAGSVKAVVTGCSNCEDNLQNLLKTLKLRK